MRVERNSKEIRLIPESDFEQTALADLIKAGARGELRDDWHPSSGAVFPVADHDPWDPSKPGNR